MAANISLSTNSTTVAKVTKEVPVIPQGTIPLSDQIIMDYVIPYLDASSKENFEMFNHYEYAGLTSRITKLDVASTMTWVNALPNRVIFTPFFPSEEMVTIQLYQDFSVIPYSSLDKRNLPFLCFERIRVVANLKFKFIDIVTKQKGPKIAATPSDQIKLKLTQELPKAVQVQKNVVNRPHFLSSIELIAANFFILSSLKVNEVKDAQKFKDILIEILNACSPLSILFMMELMDMKVQIIHMFKLLLENDDLAEFRNTTALEYFLKSMQSKEYFKFKLNTTTSACCSILITFYLKQEKKTQAAELISYQRIMDLGLSGQRLYR